MNNKRNIISNKIRRILRIFCKIIIVAYLFLFIDLLGISFIDSLSMEYDVCHSVCSVFHQCLENKLKHNNVQQIHNFILKETKFKFYSAFFDYEYTYPYLENYYYKRGILARLCLFKNSSYSFLYDYQGKLISIEQSTAVPNPNLKDFSIDAWLHCLFADPLKRTEFYFGTLDGQSKKVSMNIHSITIEDKNIALQLAAINDNSDILSLLLQNGADINSKNHKGKSALLLAAENNSIRSIKILIKNGANILDKDNEGKTVIELAVGNNLSYLLQYTKLPRQDQVRNVLKILKEAGAL